MSTSPWIHRLKITAPWFVAAGILLYLFRIYPPQQIWHALGFVELSTFIPFAIGYFLLIYAVDVYALEQMFKRFGFHVPFWEIVPARGITYLIMVVSYGAAQAGFAYFLKRTHKIPIWEALGIFFFAAMIDLYWIITLSFAGSFFLDYQLAGVELKQIVWGVTAAAYGSLALLLLVSTLKNHWLEKWSFLRIFKEAKLKDYFYFAMLRTPIHFSIIISMYIVLHTFDVHIPFVHILGNMPLVMLVGMLPITPGGLGTANAAMVELLQGHLHGAVFDKGLLTPAELIFAASLLWMFGNYLFKILAGTICLKKTSKKLFTAGPEIEEEAAPLSNLPHL